MEEKSLGTIDLKLTDKQLEILRTALSYAHLDDDIIDLLAYLNRFSMEPFDSDGVPQVNYELVLMGLPYV
ncbi:MAG: hypothetical protein NE330_02795 [Lentisphaeraceae bacterium]|nr:hypothetical protein [Lentisphaeraceae bacterium]